jgi:hypothetical protein
MHTDKIFEMVLIGASVFFVSLILSYLHTRRWSKKYLAQMDAIKADVEQSASRDAALMEFADECMTLVSNVLAAMKTDEHVREKLLPVLDPHMDRLMSLKEKAESLSGPLASASKAPIPSK